MTDEDIVPIAVGQHQTKFPVFVLGTEFNSSREEFSDVNTDFSFSNDDNNSEVGERAILHPGTPNMRLVKRLSKANKGRGEWTWSRDTGCGASSKLHAKSG